MTIIFSVISTVCILFGTTSCNQKDVSDISETRQVHSTVYTEPDESKDLEYSEYFSESSYTESSKENSSLPESLEFHSQYEQSDNDYYVLNTNSKKIHRPSCRYVSMMSSANYATTKDLAAALNEGYTKCKRCQPD